MKILLAKIGLGSSLRSYLLPATLMALPALIARADTPFTSTSYLYQVPIPGILVTNSIGQVQLKGNVHLLAVQGSDLRATGRLQGNMDLAYQADGTSLGVGPAYFELGTWQDQTNFTATGGLWVMNWRGEMLADNSSQITMSGYGLGGNIDGLRMEATVTRGPGPYPATDIPYVTSGVIKPAPVTVTNTISLANARSWPDIPLGPQGSLTVTNGQMTISAAWPGIRTVNLGDNSVWADPWRAWSVTSGHTLEARVKLVRLNQISASACLALYYNFGLGYIFVKSRDYVSLLKQNGGFAVFACKNVATSNTNVVMLLALTPSGQNVNLTARVLNGDSGEVLCELVAQDTPGSDPSLTAGQYQALTGNSVGGIVRDPAGPPWTSGVSPVLLLDQYTDGTLPAAEATFEDFGWRIYDIPPVGISRAVQITIPCAAGVSYSLESAPTLNGPWLPVNLQTPPGIQSFTVPAARASEFFRPQLAP